MKAQDDGTTNTTATILSFIGLSPLLLGTVGILHEARAVRDKDIDPKIGWILYLLYHIIVGGALGMIAAGASVLTGNNSTASSLVLLKAGLAVILLAWALATVWTLASWFTRGAKGVAYADGTTVCHKLVLQDIKTKIN